MVSADLPVDEKERIDSLKKLNILETPLDKNLERVTRLCQNYFKVPIVAISLIDSERQWFKSIQGLDVCETTREVSFCSHTILQDEVFIIADATKDERFSNNPLVTDEPHIRFYAGYPIYSADDRKIGSLCIIDSKPRHLQETDIDALKDFAALVETELNKQKNTYLNANLINELNEAKRAMFIDPLTRVWNRRGIEKVIQTASLTARTNNQKFCIAVIDVDDFKKINDTYGHSAGDTVLKRLSSTLVETLRENDAVGRFGGEEFIAIVDIQSHEKAKNLLQRVRKKVENKEFKIHDNKSVRFTITIGASFVDLKNDQSLECLFDEADKKLYQGKKSGKNKVVI